MGPPLDHPPLPPFFVPIEAAIGVVLPWFPWIFYPTMALCMGAILWCLSRVPVDWREEERRRREAELRRMRQDAIDRAIADYYERRRHRPRRSTRERER